MATSNPDETAEYESSELPSYSLVERDRRWGIARRLMEEEELAGLIVYGAREGTGPAPYAFDTYFTNDRPGALVVFAREGDPMSLVPLPMYVSDHFESVQRRDGVWLSARSVRFGRQPEGLVAILHELGLGSGAIGIVGLEPYPPYYSVPPFPAALKNMLDEQFPQNHFQPVGHRLVAMTMAQSGEELAVIRHAAHIGDAMARSMLAAARPGATESDVYAAGMNAAFLRGAVAPGLLLSSGPESIAWGPPAWSYRPQRPRTLHAGDMILAEVFVQFGMKETQHQVAIALGDVHRDFERAARLARQSYEAGLELLRPGARFGDVAEAMRRPIVEAKGSFVHPVLHGLNPFGSVSGVHLALDGQPGAQGYQFLAEIPDILPDLEIETGMTFAFEPNCALGRRAVNLGGTVVLGNRGAEELNPFTAQLLHAEA